MSNTSATKTILTNLLVSLPFPFILLLALRTTAEFPVVEKINAGVVEGVMMFLESGYGTIFYIVTWLTFAIAGTLATLFSLGSPKTGASGKNKSSSSKKPGKAPASSGTEGGETGTVKWFNVNKGFGFITTDDGEDVFVHFRSIQGRGRRSLRQGQSVRFDLTDGDKGLQAENVSVVR